MQKYLAWIGNKTTWGTPHPNTGRCNMFGELYTFETKKERDEYCNTYNVKYNTYPVPTNKKEAKAKYFAGYSQKTFDDYIEYIESIESGYIDC